MYRPEVGEECYVQTEEHAWLKSTIKMYDSGDVIYRPDGRSLYVHDCNRCQFRPLKSKRDEDIEEMRNAIHQSVINQNAACVSLHDAGYRKQIPYSDFVALIENYFYDVLGYSENNAQFQATELAAKLNRTPDEG